MRATWLGCLLLLVAGNTAAGELRVLVTDQRGKPVADAVVSALPPPGATQSPAPAPKTHTINQVALTFVPYLEVVHPGDSVVFHNSDRTRHHVYSFSTAKTFEFMLSPGQASAPLLLDRPGVIAVGCNIHDSMINYLYVSEAPWIARTGADGIATLAAIPDGHYSVHAWQPRLRPGRAEMVQDNVVVGPGAKPVSFQLALLPDLRRQPDREQARY